MTSSITLPEKLILFIDEWKEKKGSLIIILHEIQDFYGYVPKDICFSLSEKLRIPLARIYEVLTFYNYFRLTPPAKHKVAVCMGTACYLKGATEHLKTINDYLNITEGEMTKDGDFLIENVRCLGCCGLSPVMNVDGKIYGKLDDEKIKNVLDTFKEEG
jgi:NADH-quinone oxidoreductase subunit E